MRATLAPDGTVLDLRQLVAGENPLSAYTKVTVNGAPVVGCTAFDVDEGWLERIHLDAAGRPHLNETRTGVAIERIYGEVGAWVPRTYRVPRHPLPRSPRP